MKKRRGFRGASVGLFYFQDIIFLVIGIVILTSATLAISKKLELISSREGEEQPMEVQNNQMLVELAFWKRLQAPPKTSDSSSAGTPSPQPQVLPVGQTGLSLNGVSDEALWLASAGISELAKNRDQYQQKTDKLRTSVNRQVLELLDIEDQAKRRQSLIDQLNTNPTLILFGGENDSPVVQPFQALLSRDQLQLKIPDKQSVSIFPLNAVKLPSPPVDARNALCILYFTPDSGPYLRAVKQKLRSQGFAILTKPVDPSFSLSTQQGTLEPFQL